MLSIPLGLELLPSRCIRSSVRCLVVAQMTRCKDVIVSPASLTTPSFASSRRALLAESIGPRDYAGTRSKSTGQQWLKCMVKVVEIV